MINVGGGSTAVALISVPFMSYALLALLIDGRLYLFRLSVIPDI